jgi:hypothetical protein
MHRQVQSTDPLSASMVYIVTLELPPMFRLLATIEHLSHVSLGINAKMARQSQQVLVLVRKVTFVHL